MSIKENYEFWLEKSDVSENAFPIFAPVFTYEDIACRGCPIICFCDDLEKFVEDLVITYEGYGNYGDLVELLCIGFYDHVGHKFENIDKPFSLSVKNYVDDYKAKKTAEFIAKNIGDELKE